MARIRLVEEGDDPALGEAIGRIKEGRGRLINVYKLLLHAPPLALAWLELNSAVRWQTALDGSLREIVIIRVAHLNGVEYIVRDHVPAQATREGLGLAQCEALQRERGRAAVEDLFDERQRAVIAFTEAMTLDVDVGDEVFDALRPWFSERQLVELAVLAGVYNMQTRVLRALRIDPEEVP